MIAQVNGQPTYCYTGGKPFNPAQPTAVFIHGVLNDHSVWVLQTRYFAHHGWNVLAVDMPGHCRSAGKPAESVEEAARFIVALLDAVGVQKAALVGHSLGSLIALHTAASAPDRVSHLALVGTAFPMKVSPALLDKSLNQPQQAIDMVNIFSRATLAPPPSALGPGTWVFGGSKALMQRVLASNPEVNLFYTGFKACDSYNAGLASMAAVQCPILMVLGQNDQMTQPQAAQALLAQAPQTQRVMLQTGHHLMNETPEGLLHALTDFLAAPSLSRHTG
ncbi:MAG: alpha/beta fold hydrolase [Burkholderiales bacterium]